MGGFTLLPFLKSEFYPYFHVSDKVSFLNEMLTVSPLIRKIPFDLRNFISSRKSPIKTMQKNYKENK